MVIKSQSAFALALCLCTLAAYISPVIVAEEQRHVVWHSEACIIVALHLGEDSPQLRHCIGAAVDVLDNLALTVDDVMQRAHVLLVIALAHCHVAVAAHTDCHEVIIRLVALHALTEELVHVLLVRSIVPRPDFLLALQILTV